MFIEKLTEQDIEQLTKAIIKKETNAKYIVKNQVDLTLGELGSATGVKGQEIVFAYNRIVTTHHKVCKNINVNGWTVYKNMFGYNFGKVYGEKTYTISDFSISTTNEKLSFSDANVEDLEAIYRKFMFKKFGQEYVDAYVKYRKAEQRKNNKFFNNETQKNIEEMIK